MKKKKVDTEVGDKNTPQNWYLIFTGKIKVWGEGEGEKEIEGVGVMT